MSGDALARRMPAHLGPYRVESLLGAGGMGEVWSAWDERLQRRVAIKLVRADAAASPAARARFRREAQAAAALTHASVARVYDVLTLDDGEAIVMEHVEGRTLAELVRAGTLPREAALGVAVQVAEALAAAHARGIVHRDLKTENVLVTPAGEAKVVDFGLARRETDASSSAHAMVGTWRAMSPEQARARRVDHRSDLFSLGTLLYEMFAGVSPFAGASPLETLTNVCTLSPPPLREFGLPEPLSALVARLLEKDPARRPSAADAAVELRALAVAGVAGWPTPPAGAVAPIDELPTLPPAAPTPPAVSQAAERVRRPRRALIATVAAVLAVAAGAWWWAMRRPPAPSLVVAVPAAGLEGEPSEATATLRAAVRLALLRGLLSLQSVAPTAPELVDPVPGSPLDVARAVAADEVLTTRVACQVDVCRVTLARLSGATGGLLWTAGFETPVHQPALLPEAVLGHLRGAYPKRGLRAGLAPLEVAPEDFTEFLALQRGFESRGAEGVPLAEIEGRLRALRARAPLFMEAGVFEADLLRRRFYASRDRAALDQSAAMLRELRAQAPDDPRPLGLAFELAMAADDRDGAAQALAGQERLRPGDPSVLLCRAHLLTMRNQDPQRALELARSAVRLRPSWNNLLSAAQIEASIGGADGVDAARAHLEELLTRHPSSRAGQSMLAEIELLSGSLPRAAELYAQLAARAPSAGAASNLALARLLLNQLGLAEASARQAAQSEPANPFFALNLADVLLLQGRERESRTLYQRVIELAGRDPARGNWQILSVEAQALAHLGRRSHAVERLQAMLAVAGDNPQAALEAAVVYAVVGDVASTLASARRARRGGVDARWLGLPWFDGLRDLPEFRALLTPPSAASATAAAR